MAACRPGVAYAQAPAQCLSCAPIRATQLSFRSNTSEATLQSRRCLIRRRVIMAPRAASDGDDSNSLLRPMPVRVSAPPARPAPRPPARPGAPPMPSRGPRMPTRPVIRPPLPGGRGRPPAFEDEDDDSQSSRPRWQGSRSRTQQQQDGFLMNQDIHSILGTGIPEVRLLGTDKKMIGVVTLSEALDLAEDANVDVVCIQPESDPPVCRLVDARKYRYELDKVKKDAAKKQRESRQDLKELKMSPSTDVHDYNVRLKKAKQFVGKGDKVKVSVAFSGREITMKENGMELLQRFIRDMEEEAVVEQQPRMQGRVMSTTLLPRKGKE